MKDKGVYGQKTGGLLLMVQRQGQGQAACGLVNSRPYSNFPVRALSDPPTKSIGLSLITSAKFILLAVSCHLMVRGLANMKRVGFQMLGCI
jgi:hypothetical protein